MCRLDNFTLAELTYMIAEHQYPNNTHDEFLDHNNFSRFLNYVPSKDALLAKVLVLQAPVSAS